MLSPLGRRSSGGDFFLVAIGHRIVFVLNRRQLLLEALVLAVVPIANGAFGSPHTNEVVF